MPVLVRIQSPHPEFSDIVPCWVKNKSLRGAKACSLDQSKTSSSDERKQHLYPFRVHRNIVIPIDLKPVKQHNQSKLLVFAGCGQSSYK
ncbi:MAG: hypothetical protein RL662_2384 [Bacteroidota bacterium]